MRIKELADFAGTSVRTIRHYHHIGLLPIPPTSGGRRDYGTAHLARLLRIRWLARSGLSLNQIGALLSSEAPLNRDQTLDELRQTAASIDEHMEKLASQRAQIGELIETVERGGPISPLPSGIDRFYDAVESQIHDPRAHDIIAVERAMVLALHSRNLVPASVTSFLEAVTPQFQREAAELFTEFNALTRLPPGEAARPIADLVEKSMDLTAQCEAEILSMLEDLATYDHREMAGSMISKVSFLGYPHPNQRQYVNMLIVRFLEHPVFGPGMAELVDEDLQAALPVHLKPPADDAARAADPELAASRVAAGADAAQDERAPGSAAPADTDAGHGERAPERAASEAAASSPTSPVASGHYPHHGASSPTASSHRASLPGTASHGTSPPSTASPSASSPSALSPGISSPSASSPSTSSPDERI